MLYVHSFEVGGLAPLSGTSRYPDAVTSAAQSFNGCIRNLIVNNEKYDLGVPDFADTTHSQPGCTLNEAICGANGIDGGYCINGECIADAVVRFLSLSFYHLTYSFRCVPKP